MQWSAWQTIQKPLTYTGPALYELRITNKLGTPFSINRFLSIDNEGVLTIGQTKCMERRRTQFITGIHQCYGHSECNLLYFLIKHSLFDKIFHDFILQFRYKQLPTEHDAKTEEKSAIKEYICKFGEVPPLNSAIPDRYNGWPSPSA